MAFFDDAMVIAQMVILAVMISMVVGKEFKEGIFRNKAIAGHSKASIFLAELISGVGIAFVLYFLCAAIFVAFNFYEVPLLPATLIVKIFVDYVLLNMCLAAVFVTEPALTGFAQPRYILLGDLGGHPCTVSRSPDLSCADRSASRINRRLWTLLSHCFL